MPTNSGPHPVKKLKSWFLVQRDKSKTLPLYAPQSMPCDFRKSLRDFIRTWDLL
ncbi:MAG: hypothetical protein ACO2PP_05345 [Thermocrinis sp.]|uniref:hypothetical protein n=1 Tax=Thermocrinis sp. TaxID=2024383 RepID=UPI003C0741D7